MQTEITRLLGIKYPIIQGGMAWVAEHHLAAAVSEAGGLGLIGAASAPAEWVREQIRAARKLTDKPFGVNIMLMSPYAADVAKVIVEEGVQVVTTGAGSPGKYMEMWKEAGVKVIPVVASVALASRTSKSAFDAAKISQDFFVAKQAPIILPTAPTPAKIRRISGEFFFAKNFIFLSARFIELPRLFSFSFIYSRLLSFIG